MSIEVAKGRQLQSPVRPDLATTSALSCYLSRKVPQAAPVKSYQIIEVLSKIGLAHRGAERTSARTRAIQGPVEMLADYPKYWHFLVEPFREEVDAGHQQFNGSLQACKCRESGILSLYHGGVRRSQAAIPIAAQA